MLSGITLKNLWKFYDEAPVLRNISFSFKSGGMYALEGANGSGKTTLLSILCGKSRHQEGSMEYTIDGVTTTTAPDAEYLVAGVGASALYEDLTIAENMKISAAGYASFLNKSVQSGFENDAISDVLEKFNLVPLLDKRVRTLSMGNRQRLHLSRIFLCEYFSDLPWILLDEPDVFLDSDGLSCLMNILSATSGKGGTCIISSHDKDLLSRLSSERVQLEHGALIQEGTNE